MNGCAHPDFIITPVTFKDGTQHLKRQCTTCGGHMGYAPKERGPEWKGKRIHFGKHKGKTYNEVAEDEPDYFDWILRQDWSTERVFGKTRRLIEQALEKARNKPKPPPEVISKERQEAIDQVAAMRTQGLDFFDKPI